ncbi:MAG: cadmium-translocating P-type ATPase [Gammaproteobacteria bacterium]|nr:cadmium-translocating P-type ATPase [Gammaproteobacteria bacterium]
MRVLKRFVDTLAGWKMTVVSGIFLAVSLLLSVSGIEVCIEPAWISVIISGIPLLYLSVWRIVYNRGISKISSALLITIAIAAAVYIGDLFAAGEVAFIMSIGALLEERTVNRAKKGLRKLIDLTPVQGRRIRDGTEELVPAEEIRPGDTVRVLPGETIPVDGMIIKGETSIDQSIMTGESLPVDKTVDDEVFCGTVNRFGTVDISATKVGENSSFQKLVRMIREAENRQAPTQRIADKWASWLVPVAVIIAIVAGMATNNIVTTVTVLVVFCPCALVLATPTAIMAAIGQATKHGVIIKSGEALEKMGKVDTIAFDKTGTLTYGRSGVSDVMPASADTSEQELLSIAASAESRSEHPLGKAIVALAKERGISISEPTDFHMDAGKGIVARVNGQRVVCGSERYLHENVISITDDIHTDLDVLRDQGKASILIAADGTCIGVIGISDTLRPDADRMISDLGKLDTEAVLLTGDNSRTADYFARKVGITNVRAELLPGEKVDSILSLQKSGRNVCMIGDGVNDAPALKTADVGVAMGDIGSDITVDAADIALVGGDLSKIPYLKWLSNTTVRTISFSIALSMGINFVAIILSVLQMLTPTTGALVHNAGSCFVVLIAALLYDRKYPGFETARPETTMTAPVIRTSG